MKSTQPKDDFPVRWLLWVMILSLSVIFLALVSSYVRYKNTLDEYKWLNHSYVALTQITQLKSSVYEMESHGRAYLLTRDKFYQPPIETSYRESVKEWNTLDSLVSDDPEQQKICSLLLPLIQKRYDFLENSINEASRDTLLAQNVKASHTLMLQLSELMDQMLDTEYKLDHERDKITRSSIALTPVFLLVASVISFFFILFAYIMILKAYRRGSLMQVQLAQNVKSLNQSNKELEQFAYIASHDLQEPLRKLRTFAGMVLTNEDKNLSDEGKTLLKRMEFSGSRMHQLIEDLLMFSRLVNAPAEPVPVDLNIIVADVLQEVRENNKTRNIIVQVDKLPVIAGQATQLTQLFQNIVHNSVKYAKPAGDIEIRITNEMVKGLFIQETMFSERQKNFYQIAISDNGIGFDQQYAQKIFDIFQRLHGKSEYEGTGIGLAICKRVVENLRGYINAEGQQGKGATFFIYLPAK